MHGAGFDWVGFGWVEGGERGCVRLVGRRRLGVRGDAHEAIEIVQVGHVGDGRDALEGQVRVVHIVEVQEPAKGLFARERRLQPCPRRAPPSPCRSGCQDRAP